MVNVEYSWAYDDEREQSCDSEHPDGVGVNVVRSGPTKCDWVGVAAVLRAAEVVLVLCLLCNLLDLVVRYEQ